MLANYRMENTPPLNSQNEILGDRGEEDVVGNIIPCQLTRVQIKQRCLIIILSLALEQCRGIRVTKKKQATFGDCQRSRMVRMSTCSPAAMFSQLILNTFHGGKKKCQRSHNLP